MGEHHATLSPSKWDALLQCRCYKSRGGTNDNQQDGIDEHAYVTTMLTGEIPPPITGDNLARAQWAVEQIKMLGDGWLTEEKVSILDDDFIEATFGTVDFVSPTAGIFGDYKKSHYADHSWQLRVYAVGIMQRFGLESVTGYLIYGTEREIERHEYDQLDVRLVLDTAKTLLIPEPPQPCDYCGWCADQMTCPAVAHTALAVVKGYQIPDFPDWHSSNILDPSTLGQMLRAAKIVEKWADSVKSHCQIQALSGNVPDGFRVQERKGKRIVSDIPGAFAAMGMPQEQFLKCCSVTLSALQTASGMSKKIFDQTIAPVCAESKPAILLVEEK